MRQHLSTTVSPMSRVQARAVWDLVVFLFNALIFLILGAQVVPLLEAVSHATLGMLLMTGVVVSLVAIVVRIAWVPVATYLPRYVSAEMRRRDPSRTGSPSS